MLTKNLDVIISQLEELTQSLFPPVLKIYNDPKFKVEIKGDGSPLTLADQTAHNLILAYLGEHFPSIPIVSEESFVQKNYKPAKEFWLIDPIDGTKEFVSRSGEFTTNIALIQNGKPVMGVVGAPTSGKIWSGIAAEQASKAQTLKPTNTLKLVMSKNHQTVLDRTFLNFLDKRGFRLQVIARGSSLKICALADHEADLYPRFGPTSEWDIAAADAVLRSKGGAILQLENLQPLEYGKKGSILNPMFIAISNFDQKADILSLVDEYTKNLL